MTAALLVALLAPFSAAADATPPAPWRVVTLPKLTRHTEYDIVERDDRKVLRMRADNAYANLLHPVAGEAASATRLAWRWRVERAPAGADLTRKSGDDVPARVCVLFDVPAARLTFSVRTQLALGRSLFGPALPAATLCYVWDATLPAGTWLPNAYTDRVQMLVVRGREHAAGAWHSESRDLAADFARAFAREWAAAPAGEAPLPPLAAVMVAADSDNTHATTEAFIGDLLLTR